MKLIDAISLYENTRAPDRFVVVPGSEAGGLWLILDTHEANRQAGQFSDEWLAHLTAGAFNDAAAGVVSEPCGIEF